MGEDKIGLARHLRKHPAPGERFLWNALRNRRLLGAKFRRQAPVGPYVADFACEELKLVVELDGESPEAGRDRKARRKLELESLGYVVLRFGSDVRVGEGAEIVRRIAEEVERLRRPAGG